MGGLAVGAPSRPGRWNQQRQPRETGVLPPPRCGGRGETRPGVGGGPAGTPSPGPRTQPPRGPPWPRDPQKAWLWVRWVPPPDSRLGRKGLKMGNPGAGGARQVPGRQGPARSRFAWPRGQDVCRLAPRPTAAVPSLEATGQEGVSPGLEAGVLGGQSPRQLGGEGALVAQASGPHPPQPVLLTQPHRGRCAWRLPGATPPGPCSPLPAGPRFLLPSRPPLSCGRPGGQLPAGPGQTAPTSSAIGAQVTRHGPCPPAATWGPPNFSRPSGPTRGGRQGATAQVSMSLKAGTSWAWGLLLPPAGPGQPCPPPLPPPHPPRPPNWPSSARSLQKEAQCARR